MYFRRLIEDRLKRFFEHFPIVVVSGARQVGKSSLLDHCFRHIAPRIVFDPVVDIENARQDSDLFLRNRKPPIILDEIQYVPTLPSALKRKLDENRLPSQYLITGSQQWEVMKNLTESLAGRAVFLDLYGFSLGEKSKNKVTKTWVEKWLDQPDEFVVRQTAEQVVRAELETGVFETIWRGWLPEAHFLPLDLIPAFYRGYIGTYVQRDVRLLAEIEDLDLFTRFLRLVSSLTSQEVNFSHLGREIGIAPQTSRRWLNILAGTFQWLEIPAWSGNTLKKISSKPKGYLTDSGLAVQLQQISSPTALGGHPLWGPLFETAVVMEIQKQCSLLNTPPAIYHWRSHSGAEVDLILERDGKLFPIEIKAKSHPTKDDARGIKAFRESYPKATIEKGLVIAPASSFYALDEKNFVLPWDTL